MLPLLPLLPLLAESEVLSEDNVLLNDKALELEAELLELRIVTPVLISSLVLDNREFELPVP